MVELSERENGLWGRERGDRANRIWTQTWEFLTDLSIGNAKENASNKKKLKFLS